MMNYIRIATVFAGLITATIGLSCEEKQPTTEHPILKVSLKEQSVSIFDLFESVELIPLETSKESIFRYPQKIEIHNGTIYLFDKTLHSLFMFDMAGRYIGKIQNVGRGPSEYLMAYDFVLDHKNDIRILDPTASIYTYDLNGNFLRRDNLPTPPLSYHHFEMVDEETYVTWSRQDFDAKGINIINAMTSELIDNYFPNTGLWGGFRTSSVFHKYDGGVYYHECMGDRVYHITKNGYEIAYEWDTGVKIIDKKRLSATFETSINDDLQDLIDDVKEGKVPFYYTLQSQSRSHYYAMLVFNSETAKYLFYAKESGESVFFSRSSEGIDPLITYMTDDYAIGFIRDYTDTEGLQKVISSKDAELLRNRKKDDNWWLVKYTFK